MRADTMITISTAHCPGQADLEKLAEVYCHMPWQYGVAVWLDIARPFDEWLRDHEDTPIWFIGLAMWARRNGADWLRFDCDEPVLPGLPTWEW